MNMNVNVNVTVMQIVCQSNNLYSSICCVVECLCFFGSSKQISPKNASEVHDVDNTVDVCFGV